MFSQPLYSQAIPLTSIEQISLRKIRLVLLAVLLIALGVRVFSILTLHIVPESDAIEYDAIGRNLATGNGYTLDGLPTAYRAPGFPFFLAAIYSISHKSLHAAQIAQAFLETLQCLLMYFLGKRLFSPSVGLLASSFWAVFPVSILYSNLLMSESLFTCLFFLSLIIILSDICAKKRGLVLLGMLLGWATLIKPFFIVSPALLFLWKWSKKEPLRTSAQHSLYIFIVMSCIIAPWMFRNANVFHKPVITTNGGINFWIGNNENSSGGYRFQSDNNPFVGITNEHQADSLGFALGWEFILSHPGDVLINIPRKVVHLFSSESPLAISLVHHPHASPTQSFASLYIHTPLLLHLAFNVPYAFFMIWGIIGFAFMPARSKYEVRLVLFIITFFILISVVFFGISRFHYPLTPLFILASAYLITNSKQIEFKKQRLKIMTSAMLIAGFIAILAAEIVTAIFRVHS